MHVTFEEIILGDKYSRPELAKIWGYSGYQALARGVVTPRDDNKIVLFVTEEKQDFQEHYKDELKGNVLEWEGPTDHFAENRMLAATKHGDEIHVFHRRRHHSDFEYLGIANIIDHTLNCEVPSTFKLQLGS